MRLNSVSGYFRAQVEASDLQAQSDGCHKFVRQNLKTLTHIKLSNDLVQLIEELSEKEIPIQLVPRGFSDNANSMIDEFEELGIRAMKREVEAEKVASVANILFVSSFFFLLGAYALCIVIGIEVSNVK